MKDDRLIKIDTNGLIEFDPDVEKIRKDIEDYIRNSLNDYVGKTVESLSRDDIIKGLVDSLQPYYIGISYEFYDQTPSIKDSDLICQCGKDKHGFASHSNWCPKHE